MTLEVVGVPRIPLREGVSRAVEFRVALVDGEPVWSCDIATHIDGVTVVGSARTPWEAARNAEGLITSAEAE